MKFFLACVTTTLALCVPTVSLQAFDEDPAGQTRLSDQPVDPQPVPHVIGSDEGSGQATVGGSNNVPNLPARSVYYDEPVFSGPGASGYQMTRDIFTVQYRLDTRAGGLQGYDDGYTNFGAFIPMLTTPDSLFFTDIRALITHNSDGGMNLGIGRRWYDPSGDRVWSNSFWYDMVNSNSQAYHQVGHSSSLTTRYWRYRTNSYLIVSDRDDFVGTQFGNTPFLTGNEIHLNRTRTQETAYHGFDMTVGGPMPLLGRFGINWDTGLYYNWADAGKDGIGWMFNADAQLTEDINMGFRYRNDNVFGANAQLSLLVNFPDGRASRILRQPSVRDYLLKPDERKYTVSARRFNINDSVPLLNASDSLPLLVANLIPDGTAGVAADGDGTIETPFNGTDAWNALTGAEKAEFDIVLVRPGTIPTDALGDPENFMNNLISGMTIVENQRLLASTGRLVRDLDTNGAEIIRYAEHRVVGDVAGLGTGLNYGLPGSGVLPPALDGTVVSLVGTIFDPTVDPRPILANHTSVVSTRPHAVVTIDNSFSVACTSRTEVSGFVIEATNPNMPTMPNNGIVTGNILNPAQGTGITGFDINSNLIRNAVHGVHITSLGDSFGTIMLNRVEGDGFNSNSGINVYHSGGALGFQLEDNLVFHVSGEDIDNDGKTDIVPGGTEDVNGNGKLDIGEDLDGDGVIDIDEDNDKDGILSDDDTGIGYNIVANSAGATIISNNPHNNATNDPANHESPALHIATPYDAIAAGLNPNDPTDHLHILRNKTHLSESEYFRTQTVDPVTGIVSNAFTAQDINGDIDLVLPTTVVQNSDTFDDVGNKNGMNLEARDGGIFRALVFGNDTSHNNPYVLGVNPTDPDLMPPKKNPFLTVVPTALGNEFGFKAHAIGVGSIMDLSSPDAHFSNNNFGHGAIIQALNTSTLIMSGPMTGLFTESTIAGVVTVIATTPSQYNNNGLNGLLLRANNNSTMTVQIGRLEDRFDGFHLNEFLGNGQDGDATTPGNGIEIDLTDSTLLGYIGHNNISTSADNGILFRNNNSLIDNIAGSSQLGFTIKDNNIQNSANHGIHFDFLDAPTDNLTIVENNITGIETSLGLTFFIDGDTFGQPFSLTNTSAATRNITNLVLDTTASNTEFDTVEPGDSVPFLPSGGTDITTGLIAVNGTAITQGSDPLADDQGNVLAGGGVPDNSQVLSLTFDDFNPTESFIWDVDLDIVDIPASTVTGDTLIGSTVSVTFDNGSILAGSLVAVAGNTDASEFVSAAVGQLSLGDGIRFDLVNSTLTDLVISRNTINGNGQNGINFNTVSNSNLSNVVIESNEINDNPNGDGIRLLNPQFATNAEGDNQIHYKLNTINNNGGYGINMTLNNANHLDSVICANDISGNTLGGVNVELSDNAVYHNGLIPPATLLTPDPADEESWFFGNTINNNGGIGYHITAEDNSVFTLVGSLPLASTINGNQDAGIGIEMSDNVVGDIRLDNITIDGNQDADFGVATDDVTFNGEGIGIVLNDNSVLNNMRIGDPILINPANPGTARPTNITNNLNNGISIVTSGNSSLQETLIANANISGNGTNGTGDGINVVRNQTSIVGDDADVLPAVNPVAGVNTVLSPIAPIAVATTTVIPNTVPDAPADAFVIRDSIINNNGGDGIDLTANLANINDEYLIEQNDISGNGANGVRLFAQGDAEMLVDIRYSTINNNGNNGIQTIANLNNITDEVSITGTWVGLQVDGNTNNGIQLNGIFGDLNGVNRPLQIGSNFTEDVNNNGLLDPGEDLDGDGRLDSDAVSITNNGAHGIDIPGSGTYAIYNTLIDGNGQSGVNATFTSNGLIDRTIISNNTLHGINMASTGFFNNMSLTMTNSLIENNTRDGLQLSVNPGGGNTLINFTGAANPVLEVTLDTNVVRNNGGRGIDTTVQGDGSASLEINNIVVTGNGEQGIYNLVTASTTQDLEASAATALAQDGSIFANAFLNFAISADAGFDITSMVPGQAVGQNLIANNGLTDTYDGGGLVFRVGTTGARQNLIRPYEDNNTVDPTSLGGLVASIEDTNIIGNNGVDFWMHTFVSTVDPTTTTGSWTDQNTAVRDNPSDVYTPGNFQQDPLARIQIDALSNLTGGSADAFGRSGTFTTNNDQEFAFYNNNESVFKSRGRTNVGPDNNTDGGADDNGPFNTGARQRNATRLAARTTFINGTPLPPFLTIVDSGGNSDNFLYPGVGESTLQINNTISAFDRALNGFTTSTFDFTSQIGIVNNGGISFFDTSYMWENF